MMRPGSPSRRARHRQAGPSGRAPITPAYERRKAADAVRRRRRRTTAWAAALIVVGAAAVGIELAGTSRAPAPDRTAAAGRPTTSAAQVPAQLRARDVGRIPFAIQDAAAAPLADKTVALLGGLDATDVSRSGIVTLKNGSSSNIGSLPTPLHDAAAVALGSSVYLFGGGQSASSASILAVDPRSGRTSDAGALPEPRSDLAAASLNGTAYLIGGYTGQQPLDTILAWRPGQPARVVGHLPQPLRYAAAAADGNRIVIAGGQTPQGPTRQIVSFDPATGGVASLGSLPQATSHAAAAALDGYVYVVGGRDGTSSPMRSLTAVDPASGAVTPAGSLPQPLSDATATAAGATIVVAGGQSGAGPVNRVLELSDDPGSAKKPTANGATPSLRPGSDPSVLPGNVLIADKANNRLLVVTPRGQIVWSFPRPGDLKKGQSFLVPDDAFFTYDGRQIVATQEDDFVISLIDMGGGRIAYRYGHPGVPGSSPGYVYNPDDAIRLKDGNIVSADIKNCRLLELKPPLQNPVAQMGATGACYHGPPAAFSSPNGAFPLSNGGTVVTEINGQWIDVFDRSGKLTASTNPPGFSYPSDTNEVRPGVYLTVDYAQPGTIMELTGAGKVLWRFSPSGPDELNHPSLALPLPNGDVLANDDYNDRVIVVDPRTNRIVWQYGHTGVSGTQPGYLNIPDGVDLAPPYSLSERFPQVRGLPGH